MRQTADEDLAVLRVGIVYRLLRLTLERHALAGWIPHRLVVEIVTRLLVQLMLIDLVLRILRVQEKVAAWLNGLRELIFCDLLVQTFNELVARRARFLG